MRSISAHQEDKQANFRCDADVHNQKVSCQNSILVVIAIT